VIAIAVMIIGVGYIAMLTAALAQVFLTSLVGKEAKAVEKEVRAPIRPAGTVIL
jgi:hypothetical protein